MRSKYRQMSLLKRKMLCVDLHDLDSVQFVKCLKNGLSTIGVTLRLLNAVIVFNELNCAIFINNWRRALAIFIWTEHEFVSSHVYVQLKWRVLWFWVWFYFILDFLLGVLLLLVFDTKQYHWLLPARIWTNCMARRFLLHWHRHAHSLHRVQLPIGLARLLILLVDEIGSALWSVENASNIFKFGAMDHPLIYHANPLLVRWKGKGPVRIARTTNILMEIDQFLGSLSSIFCFWALFWLLWDPFALSW